MLIGITSSASGAIGLAIRFSATSPGAPGTIGSCARLQTCRLQEDPTMSLPIRDCARIAHTRTASLVSNFPQALTYFAAVNVAPGFSGPMRVGGGS